MSQASVDLVLAWLAAYNSKDYDAAVDLCSPDVEAFPDASVFPEAVPVSGRDDLRVALGEYDAAWVSAHYATREVIDLEDDRVLTTGNWGGKGIESGIEISQDLNVIFAVRNEQIVRIEWLFDADKALKAAGLAG
jgi:ketosteroid isomerase-like protein